TRISRNGESLMADNTKAEGSSAQSRTRDSHLFLVRLWAEEDGNGNEEWCGKVQHVLTGKAGHFANLGDMAGLVESLMPEDGAEQVDVSGETLIPAEASETPM